MTLGEESRPSYPRPSRTSNRPDVKSSIYTVMSREPTPVLIVGGGPSGLVLAIALLRSGVPVRIIEKTWVPRLGQRGAGLMPRSLELFTMLGMIEPVLKRAICVPLVRKYKLPEGVDVLNEFAMSPLADPTPTHPFLNLMLLGQDTLETVFHEELAKLGCSVENGTELVSFKQNADFVEVNLLKRGPKGDQEERETCRYEWMVGTDGAKGVVRKQLGLTFLGETRLVENFVVGDICVEGLSPKYWHMWGEASDVLISLRPTETKGLYNFIIAGKDINNAELAASQDTIRDCFRKNTGNRKDIKFGEMPWMSYYTPNIRMVDAFSKGRIFIAGDAGHVHSPTGGQGVNTGMQDSFNLGWKLALVAKGLASPSLLNTYSNERLPVIAEMLDQTTKLLNSTFNGGSAAEWQNGGALFQLGVNYRWSTIVMDERKSIEAAREAEEDALMEDFEFEDDGDDEKIDSYGTGFDGRLRAGDRAPDSSGLIKPGTSMKPFNKSHQLFQIFTVTRHTVLLFADFVECDEILQDLQRYPKDLLQSVVVVRCKRSAPSGSNLADHVLEDHDGHAYEAYTSSVCGVIVVRPDGIIGGILRGSNSLRRYFQNVLASP